MISVTALQSFDHYGRRRRGDMFEVSEHAAAQLRARGLVSYSAQEIVTNPPPAAGAKRSASPAAPASPPTTAKKSGNGKAKSPRGE
jgi:hypothetical protein